MRQKPIDPKRKPFFEAHVGFDKTWGNYYSQYKQSVDLLVEKVEGGTPINTVSLPLLYLIRHSLELILKNNIIELQVVNKQIKPISLGGKGSHSLESLFGKFNEHLKEIISNYTLSSTVKKEIIKYQKDLKGVKDKLHSLDAGSYNFRYPVDTAGNQNFKFTDRIHVGEIVDAYYEVQPFLMFTLAVLADEGIFGDSKMK